jgi:hypothetical protein
MRAIRHLVKVTSVPTKSRKMTLFVRVIMKIKPGRKYYSAKIKEGLVEPLFEFPE